MKSKKIFALIIALLAFPILQAHAQVPDSPEEKLKECLNAHKGWRDPVPIDNHNNIPVFARSGKALTLNDVKQAIELGSKNTLLSSGKGAKGRPWTTEHIAKGKVLATLNVRKHRIIVEVDYNANQYSLRYKDSAEMDYLSCEGKPYIHPSYNKWVLELKNGIQAQFNAL